MKNTNYFVSIVKILAFANEFSIENQVKVKQLYVQVPQKRGNSILSLLVWGNLSQDIEQFYDVNDYILVEGYTFTQPKKDKKFVLSNSKKIFITVTKIYPMLLGK